MPTPFTHLETAQRLLNDTRIPESLRAALEAEKPAFLLGNIAADARTGADIRREDTHFYDYSHGIREHPWRVMMRLHPSLHPPASAAQRAFLAGYVAHLAMDETWTLNMLGPHFAVREWAPRPTRFLMLHILLIYMDERDFRLLLPWQNATLKAANPANWLPFLSDTTLCDWRDFIGDQIAPGGVSQTLEVFGGRINRTSEELRAILDSPARMRDELWANILPETLASIEAQMYDQAREQMGIYWQESEAVT
jgi:Zinc dependent phospholipase C